MDPSSSQPQPPLLDHSLRAELTALVQSLFALDDEAIEISNTPVFFLMHMRAGPLFQHYPKWYSPLLTTPRGHRTLYRLLVDVNKRTKSPLGSLFAAHIDPIDIIQFVLTLQQMIVVESTRQLRDSFSVFEVIPAKACLDALLYYLHPAQAPALAQLQASLPTPPLPLPQSNVPPAALPLLFPMLDTTQFAPQFDWFMYLLSQYFPVNSDKRDEYADFEPQLSKLLDTVEQPLGPTAKPGLPLDQVFVHNHLLNSYTEYLNYMLPSLSQEQQQGTTADTNASLPSADINASLSQLPSPAQQLTPQQQLQQSALFPYFPNPHPLYRPFQIPFDFSSSFANPSKEFSQYFIFMFLLGPSLGSVSTPILDLLKTSQHPPRLPLRVQLFTHQYRAWYIATATSHSAQPPIPTITPINNNTNNATSQLPPQLPSSSSSSSPHLLPPPQPHPLQCAPQLPSPLDFTANPWALFQLTLLSWYSCDLKSALQPNKCPINHFKCNASIFNLRGESSSSRFFLSILSHCFPDNQTLREALVEEVAGRLLFLETVALHTRFSYTLYEHGYFTLHQYARRAILQQIELLDHKTPYKSANNLIKSFLWEPFASFQRENSAANPAWDRLVVHITLCVHAGFLSPPPLCPSDITTLSDSGPIYTPASPDSVLVYLNLVKFRAFLHAVLVHLTGLLSYFCPSTQLLANAVRSVAPLADFYPRKFSLPFAPFSNPKDLPFLPPHSIPHPCDTLPNLKAALIDDDGMLYAIKYSSDEPDNAASTSAFAPNGTHKNSWWLSQFPPQGAPAHWHIFRNSAMDDLRACITWNTHQLHRNPHLADVDVGPDYPGISPQDLAWIESESNQQAMKSPETRRLQKQLSEYYRQVNEVETNMVVSQMQKVLFKADQAGLFDLPSPFPSQRNYLLPDLPMTGFFAPRLSDLHDKTFTMPRGVLYRGKDGAIGNNYLYDHNYSATWATGHLNNSGQVFDSSGRVSTDGTFSMLPYFRQRSDWALELLIVGCFGLQPPLPPSPHPPSLLLDVNCPPPPPSTPPSSWSFTEAHTPRFEHCKDIVTQRLPTLFGGLQHSPTLPPDPQADPQTAIRLSRFLSTLSRLTLLISLPLYETLLALPSAPLSPPPVALPLEFHDH